MLVRDPLAAQGLGMPVWGDVEAALLSGSRYDGGLGMRDYGRALAVDPQGLRVYGTGFSRVSTTALEHDFLTFAYLVDEEALVAAALGCPPLS